MRLLDSVSLFASETRMGSLAKARRRYRLRSLATKRCRSLTAWRSYRWLAPGANASSTAFSTSTSGAGLIT